MVEICIANTTLTEEGLLLQLIIPGQVGYLIFKELFGHFSLDLKLLADYHWANTKLVYLTGKNHENP